MGRAPECLIKKYILNNEMTTFLYLNKYFIMVQQTTGPLGDLGSSYIYTMDFLYDKM